MSWMQQRVGRYPFDLYGSLIVEADIGFALESQTLELVDTTWFDYGQGVWSRRSCTSCRTCGSATACRRRRGATCGSTRATPAGTSSCTPRRRASWSTTPTGYPDDDGYATFDELMKAVYAHGDQWRADSGPVALPSSSDTLFDLQRYHGGALVLYALRQQVGAATFQRIEREWLRAYEGRSASTDDFIALASRVSGQDLSGFLRAWVYGTTTPPMPGHPDWTVDPVTDQSAAKVAPLLAPAAGRPRK